MIVLEAVVCGAFELYCVLLTGVSALISCTCKTYIKTDLKKML